VPLRVEFSADAELDLDYVTSYLVRNAPQAAERFADAFDRLLERLTMFPESGRPLQSGRRLALVVGTEYVVVYALSAERVLILSLKHGAQQQAE